MNKIRIIFYLFACLISLSAVAKGKDDGFTVKFNIKKAPDCYIFVSQVSPDATEFYCDTLELEKGKAVYKGNVDYPQLYHFTLSTPNEDYMGGISIFVENGEKVAVEGNTLNRLQAKGNGVCNEFIETEKRLQPLFKEYYKYSGELSEARKQKQTKEAEALRASRDKAFDAIYEAVINDPHYAESPVSPYYVFTYFRDGIERLETSLNKLSPVHKDNGYVKSAANELKKQKQTALGQAAYNFCLNDLAGKEYKLSDYRGKYVLIEFSASWCGWCKKEIPFLKKVYNAHKDNDRFVMFTINLDDHRSKWENDVKKENLPWKVISNMKGFKSEVTEAYNVHGIPNIFLISPEGKIIEKHLRGDHMINVLNKYLPEDKAFEFTVEGTIDNFKNGTITVYDNNGKFCEEKVVDGKYTIKGQLKERQTLQFGASKEGSDYNEVIFAIYMQEGTIKAHSYPYRNFYRTNLEGAIIQDKIDQIQNNLKHSAEYDEFDKVSTEIQNAYRKHSTAPKELKKKQNEYIYQALSKFFQKGDEVYEEAFAFTVEKYSALLTHDQIYSFLNPLHASVRKVPVVNELIQSIEREKKVSKGKEAPDFVARDIAGKEYHLTDFRGKYVYLEFSASWCGWCKKEIPFMKTAYDKLKGKDIVIITMMMDDKLEVWKKDVEKYQLPWLSLSDLKGMKHSEIAKMYNISGVPMSFLINPEGIIVEKDLRGEDLLPTLLKHIKH